MSEKRTVLKAAGVVGGITLLSRFTGLIRDVLITALFGARGIADTFFVAFEIPNLLRRVLGEGALSSFLVPLFSQRRQEEGDAGGWRFFNLTLNFMLVVSLALTVLGILFSREVYLVAGGLGQLLRGGDAGQTGRMVDLGGRFTAIMFPFLIGLSMASLMMGACHALRRFVAPSLGSVMLNIALIAAGGAALALNLEQAPAAIWLCWAVLVGSLVRVLIMLPTLHAHGWRWRPVLNLRDPELYRLLRMLATGTLSMSISQINIVVAGFFALYLGEGIKTYLMTANRLVQLPMALTATAVATAMLPQLTQYLLEGRHRELGDLMGFTKRLEIVLMLPAIAGLIVFGQPIMELLFERRLWSAADTRAATLALLCYAPSLLPLGGARLLTSLFYARKDVVTPLKAGALSMLVNVILNAVFALSLPLAQAGLALAFTVGTYVNYALLAWYARRDFGEAMTEQKQVGATLARSTAAALLACGAGALAYYPLRRWLPIPLDSALTRGALLLPVIALVAGLYFVLAHALRVPDADRAKSILTRRLKLNRKP